MYLYLFLYSKLQIINEKISLNLKNKNVIITGGNGFLGSQISEALINEKAKVYIIDIKNPKKEH